MRPYTPTRQQDLEPSRCDSKLDRNASPLLNRRRHGMGTQSLPSRGLLGVGFFFFALNLLAQQLIPLPPQPPTSSNVVRRANIIMLGQSVSTIITNPTDFLIVDTRFSNYFGSVSFTWKPNTEPDLAGYFFYHGPRAGFYTNLIFIEPTANRFTLDNVCRTNRNYFALSAFNTMKLESELTHPPLVWPEPPSPAYTNYIAVMYFEASSNLVDWTTFLAVTNYFTPTNFIPQFYRTRWGVQRWP